jgi:hypothetical protein
MFDQLDNKDEDQQQFIAELDNCTANHKGFADRPFIIPQLPYEVIDKIMMGEQIGNLDAKYKKDYSITGFLHLYVAQEIRIIHGINKIKKMDMHVLGRTIQTVYN